MTVIVSVDAMGGDHGLSVTIPASLDLLQNFPDSQIRLVGLVDQLETALKKAPSELRERITIVPATEVVAMDDPIEIALRKKKDSSMRVAIEQVKEKLADAAVSAGNTDALMAISRYILKTLEGVDRPAAGGLLEEALPHVRGDVDGEQGIGGGGDQRVVGVAVPSAHHQRVLVHHHGKVLARGLESGRRSGRHGSRDQAERHRRRSGI